MSDVGFEEWWACEFADRMKGSKYIGRCAWRASWLRYKGQLAASEARERRLREACRDMVDALRFIRDHENRGLIAQHGDALEAGLAALRLTSRDLPLYPLSPEGHPVDEDF